MSTATRTRLGTLNYVILFVEDTEKSLAFYRDLLGLEVKRAEKGWVELATGTTTLALHSQENLEIPRHPGQPSMVFGVEDIHTAYAELQARGVEFAGEPHQVCETPTHLGMSANFHDPDGNLLSIYAMVEKK